MRPDTRSAHSTPRSTWLRSAPSLPVLPVLLVLLVALLAAPAARAGTIVITFTATITASFGNLAAELAVGDPVTGTIELDDTVVGVFTPGTVFQRAEMLYTGAVTSLVLDADGNPISGTGGDVLIKDSDGPLNGDDRYETHPVPTTGTIGGVAATTFFFSPAYDNPEYTLSAGLPLFAPPPLDPAKANQISFNGLSAAGSAFGRIDTMTTSGGTPVPALPPVVWALGACALAAGGALRARGLRR